MLLVGSPSGSLAEASDIVQAMDACVEWLPPSLDVLDGLALGLAEDAQVACFDYDAFADPGTLLDLLAVLRRLRPELAVILVSHRSAHSLRQAGRSGSRGDLVFTSRDFVALSSALREALGSATADLPRKAARFG